jgi:hypothetical protein
VQVDSSGNFGTVSSSQRYKENVRQLEIDTSMLYKLRPCSFDYRSNHGGAKNQFGLIAEEVNQYLPQLVDYDKEGRPDYVAYNHLPVLLLSELQKHEQAIKEIKEQLKQLLN